MRSIKYALVACAAATVLAGCYSTRHDYDYDAQGRPYLGETGIYEGAYRSRGSGVLLGLNRGVNTNWYGPVNSGTEAARGPGTSSGGD